MNKISFYAVILAFIITGGVWFFFVKSDLPEEIILDKNGKVIIDESSNKINNNLPVKEQEKTMKATLQTNKGDITIEFDLVNAPNTVANFIKLAKDGFYDGTKFHRVIKGFMNQGGDPFSKDDAMMARWGTGGPGYSFNDEISTKNHNEVGTIAMANSGPNTNGSQFFINVGANNNLDTKHTVFGKVTSGLDVVMLINSTPTDVADRPISPVILENVTLE